MAGHCGARAAMAAPLRQRAAGGTRWVCSAAAQRPWKLFGAMCLLRLPRITQPLEKVEEEMAALMEQVKGGVCVCMAEGVDGEMAPSGTRGEQHQGLAHAVCDVGGALRFAPHLVGIRAIPVVFLCGVGVSVTRSCCERGSLAQSQEIPLPYVC